MNILLIVVCIEFFVLILGGIVYVLIDQKRRMHSLKKLVELWDRNALEVRDIADKQSHTVGNRLGLREESTVELRDHLMQEQLGFLSDTFRRMERMTPESFASFAEANARAIAEHDEQLLHILQHDHERVEKLMHEDEERKAREQARLMHDEAMPGAGGAVNDASAVAADRQMTVR